jgi:pimeloyl-ACP methyl ester carboxylesterase
VNKPGIFFVKGFSINPFASSDDGLGAMVDNVPSSELFSWNNADELIEAISTRPHAQPIILVGHGMGSDTIVDVANRLNAVEHGFRRVDLLVTMDSVGTDNDIIPQNVKENFNVISDVDTLFNDGPNIARKKSMTKVENELRAESHSELEASPEVQFMIYEKINRSLMGAIERKDLKKTLNEQMLGIHQLASPNSTAKIQNLLSSRPSVNSQSNF